MGYKLLGIVKTWTIIETVKYGDGQTYEQIVQSSGREFMLFQHQKTAYQARASMIARLKRDGEKTHGRFRVAAMRVNYQVKEK